MVTHAVRCNIRLKLSKAHGSLFKREWIDYQGIYIIRISNCTAHNSETLDLTIDGGVVNGVDIQGWVVEMYIILARLRPLPTGLHQIVQPKSVESFDRTPHSQPRKGAWAT